LASRDVTLSKAAVSRRSFWTGFLRDRRGVVGVAVAVFLPVLIGFAGIEVGSWFWVQRQNQSAADAAAIAAGLEYAAQIQSNVPTNPSAAATTAASYNLFSNANCSTSGTTNCTLYPCYGFTVGSSCNTSTSNGVLSAVQVALTQPLNTAFASFVTAIWGPNISTINVTTTAIAAFPQTSNACVLALDPAAASAVSVDNGTLSNTNCWVAANSSSASALNCNGCTIAGPTTAVGGDAVSNGGQFSGSPNRTYASATANPYAGVVVAAIPPVCSVAIGTSINQGHYCNGVQVPDGFTLTMLPGVYYIDQLLNIGENATLNASDGVTIVINGGYPIIVGANSTLKITAQTTGPFAGIAIFGNASPGGIQEFTANGQNNINIRGAIYFPSQTIHFDPNFQLNPSACTQIIGDKIHIEANANVNNSCAGTGVTSIRVLEVYLTL
jgi:Flp pilus assembly protein TadG